MPTLNAGLWLWINWREIRANPLRVDNRAGAPPRCGIISSMSWGEVCAAQDGVASRAQLMGCGLSGSAVDRLVASGAVRVVSRGVFVARGAPLTYRARLWCGVLATGGALGFGTAAHLWGIEPSEPRRIELIVDPNRRLAIPDGVRLHRVFVPKKALQHRDGLPTTTMIWTVLDHLGRLPHPDACRLADRALQRRWITTSDIARRLRDYPGRRGNTELRRIAAQAGDGAAAESERILHRILATAGINDWVANYPVWHGGALVAVVDIALVGRKVAIEADGWAFHSDVERFQRDRQRQNALSGLGWTVLRFTWADLTERPSYVARTVRRQLMIA